MDVNDLPGGLASQVQMHMLSVDVSSAVAEAPSWLETTEAVSRKGFPAYAQARAALSNKPNPPGQEQPPPNFPAPSYSRSGYPSTPYGPRLQRHPKPNLESDCSAGEAGSPTHANSDRACRQLAGRRKRACAAARRAEERNLRTGALGRLAIGPAVTFVFGVDGRPISGSESSDGTRSISAASSGTSMHGTEDSQSDAVGGFLRKKGRRSRMRLLRFFTVEGCVLRSYKDEVAMHPSWAVNLHGAIVGVDIEKFRIVLLLDNDRKLVLYARSVLDAQLWADSFAKAADSKLDRCAQRLFCPVPDKPSPMERDPHVVHSHTDCRAGPIDEHPDMENVGSNNMFDPACDVWDTFRSFGALHFVNGKRKQAQIAEIPPYLAYASLV